jgi:anti-sigma B factor antagonist
MNALNGSGQSAESVITVRLPVEMDMDNAVSVGADLWSALHCGAQTVIADMTETTFCDSSGLGELAVAHQAALDRGTELRVVVTSAQVRRVLALTRLDRVLAVYPSLDAALSGPPRGQTGT